MSLLSRRNFFKLLGLASVWKCVAGRFPQASAGGGTTIDQRPFSFEMVKHEARVAAKRAYLAQSPLPKSLAKLNYDAYRLIAFRHEESLWRDEKLPFWTEFHHRGFVHRDQIDMFIVNDGKSPPRRPRRRLHAASRKP